MRILLIFLFFLVPVRSLIAENLAPRFEKSACPFANDKLEGVDCGYVTVPENRDHPNGRTLRLAVVVMHNNGASTSRDPLVFLSGGPGQRSVFYTPQRTESKFWNKLREKRDLVFFDQRGTGYSDPAFCPELYEVFTAAFKGLSPQKQTGFQTNKLKECRAKLLKQGIDFSAYNSKVSAQDLEDIRKALGYQ